MRSLVLGFATLLALAAKSACVDAAIIVGGISFDDNAFVDTVIQENSPLFPFYGALTVSDALVGSNPANGVDLLTGSVLLGFTDNLVVNGTGSDLALFEGGPLFSPPPEGFVVSLSVSGLSTPGEFVVVPVSDTGFNAASNDSILVGYLDLSSLGLPVGATINQIAIATDIATAVVGGADLTVVGAINNSSPVVPEPASLAIWSMLGLVGVGVGWRRRSRKLSQV